MNPKTTIGLVVALLFAVGGVWWAQSSSNPEEQPETTGPTLLFELSAGDVTDFEVKSGSASTCVLTKEGSQWRMSAPISGPGQQTTIDQDVSKIVTLEYVESYSSGDPDRPTDDLTALNNPLKIVKLTDKDDNAYVLKIGARQKLSNKTYVQKEGDDTIYLVNGDLNQDMRRSLSDYRGKRVSEFKTAEAVRIEVQGNQNYALAKQDKRWTIDSPVKARAEVAPVNILLNSLSSLSALDFVEDAPKSLRPYGLGDPRLTVAITTEKRTRKPTEPVEGPTSQPVEPEYDVETKTIRVAFGGTADDKVFAKLDEPDGAAVFQVDASVLEKIAPPLKDLRDKKIVNLQINQAEKVTVNSGADSIELVKSGSDWKINSGIEELPSNKAEFAAVDDLLKTLRDLKATGFEVGESPNFGFGSPRAVIEVSQSGQVEPLKVVVGATTPSKTGAYIRNEREDFVAVVPADKASALTAKPIAFLSRELLKFSPTDASKLNIVRPGKTYAVQRENNVWQFSEPVQGKAEITAVTNIMSDLSNLRGRRVVARAAEAARYGLDSPAVQATVTLSPPPTAQPAESPPTPPTLHTVLVKRHVGKVYAMVAGGSTICEVDAKILTDLEAELLETKVVSMEPSLARRLAFSGEGTFTFEKNGDDWSLVGESSFQTDPSKMTEMLESLRDLRAKHYVSYKGADLSSYGLQDPAVTIGVETTEGDSLALMISGKGPGSDRYASISTTADQVFVIKLEDLTKLLKKVTDFQKTN
ncbi:MAG: DUF4340 domain-containing protein [Phycisphaerales bacterium]|nr:DUF4340 domain-containing protein [Phycisphaerales bacterium]